MEKEKKFMIIGVFILLITLVGAAGTYAWFTWSSTNNTNLTMSIGASSDVIFKNGNDISTNKLAPVFNYTDGEKTSFTIINKSTTNFKYKVLLNITSIADELKNSALKYKLISNNTIITEGNFKNIESINNLYEGELSKGNVSYTFYLYIDGNEENNLNMMGKTINGNINIIENVTFSEYITNLYTFSSKQQVANNNIIYNYAASVGLMNDRLGSNDIDIDNGNIRYYGIEPNNYIYFNCDNYANQTSDTCEVWRIIGVFNDKVKIIRNQNIGTFSYDNKNISSGAETESGKNDWGTARLMKLLNPSDYYEIDTNDNEIGQSLYWNSQSGTCFAGQNNATKTCDFTNIGIKNDMTRNMIMENIYTIKGYNYSNIYVDEIYDKEVNNGIVYGERLTEWVGKVALPYPSDYGYAVDLSICKNSLKKYESSECINNNWMVNIITNDKSNWGWLITPYSASSNSAWYVNMTGYVNNNSFNVYYSLAVTPVVYLDSKLSKSFGKGTSSSPYQLSI